jgi:hypothetical protein
MATRPTRGTFEQQGVLSLRVHETHGPHGRLFVAGACWLGGAGLELRPRLPAAGGLLAAATNPVEPVVGPGQRPPGARDVGGRVGGDGRSDSDGARCGRWRPGVCGRSGGWSGRGWRSWPLSRVWCETKLRLAVEQYWRRSLVLLLSLLCIVLVIHYPSLLLLFLVLSLGVVGGGVFEWLCADTWPSE